jgi:hypothetical protein
MGNLDRRSRLINRGTTPRPGGKRTTNKGAVIFNERFYHPLYLALNCQSNS